MATLCWYLWLAISSPEKLQTKPVCLQLDFYEWREKKSSSPSGPFTQLTSAQWKPPATAKLLGSVTVDATVGAKFFSQTTVNDQTFGFSGIVHCADAASVKFQAGCAYWKMVHHRIVNVETVPGRDGFYNQCSFEHELLWGQTRLIGYGGSGYGGSQDDGGEYMYYKGAAVTALKEIPAQAREIWP